jgi:hypothetical protein
MGTSVNDRKPTAKKTTPVWRITEKAPKGEWVIPSNPATPAPKIEVPEVTSGSWVISSFDLLHGTDITEGPDTLPGDLFDELFPPKKDKPTRS